MKILLSRYLPALLLCFFAGHTSIFGQTPIAFGQSLTGTLPTTSSSVTYTTPYSKPGDILFIRITPNGIKLQFELYSPSGALLDTFPGAFATFNQAIYPIPSNGESGNYKIIVSNTGIWTGNFCITLERMNEPPTAKFLGCGTSLQDTLQCGSSIRSFRYLVQQNTLSRITVAPNLGIAPEVWVCTRSGAILRHGTASYTKPIIFDTLPAPESNCYYVLVADAEGYWHDDFSVSHTIISGACAAVSLQSIPANGSLCQGGDFTLTASSPLPNATYAWSGPNGFTSTQPEITFTNAAPAQSGAYSVTVTTPDVCSSIATQTITVNSLPNAEAVVTPASGMVCPGQNIDLNVNPSGFGPFSYQWSKQGGGYSSTFKSPIIPTSSNADTSKSGVYIIIVTDAHGCSNADSIEIHVNSLPSATISSPPNGAACLGSTLFLDVMTDASNANFLWSGPQGFSSTIQNPFIPNVAFLNGGTYNVTVTNSTTGCTRSASKSITINSLPNANISGNLSICAGTSTTLTATGGGTYLWSTGATTNTITVSPNTTKDYSVTATNTSTGCTNSKTATVTVKPLPSLTISSTPASPEICSGDGNILLCAISDAESPSYQWTGPGFFSSQQCVSFNTPSQTGTYQASVTSGTTGCSNLTSLPVYIFASPTVSILPVPAGAIYCDGDDFALCANSNASAPTYEWKGPGGLTASTLCLSVNNAKASQAGNYDVTVTDSHGCTGASGLIVVVDNPVSITASATGNQITATATGGTPPFQYFLSPGNQSSNTGTFQNLQPGTYTVTATDDLGCFASTSGIIIVVGIVEPSTEWGLAVTPNPGSGFFEVLMKNTPASALQFDVFSGSGRLLRSFSMETAAKTLDLTDLPDGLYIIRVSDKEKTGIIRLVILR